MKYDEIDKNEIKFGLWMAFHHPKDEFVWGMSYALGIIKRGLFKGGFGKWENMLSRLCLLRGRITI